jgi:hypothetical protein
MNTNDDRAATHSKLTRKHFIASLSSTMVAISAPLLGCSGAGGEDKGYSSGSKSITLSVRNSSSVAIWAYMSNYAGTFEFSARLQPGATREVFSGTGLNSVTVGVWVERNGAAVRVYTQTFTASGTMNYTGQGL